MQNYFIKATYNGNVYKLSDFYNPNGSYKIDPNKMLDFDMAYNDGISTAITQIKLPDGTEPVNYTHIIVPDQKKIYRIAGVEWLNFDARKITLAEDPLIGNWNELNDTKINLSMTNDFNLFTGITDIVNTRKKKKYYPFQGDSELPGGKVALLYFSSDTTHIKMKINEWPASYDEQFASLADLYLKYPNVEDVYNTSTIYYVDKIVKIGSIVYQFQNTSNYILEGYQFLNYSWQQMYDYPSSEVTFELEFEPSVQVGADTSYKIIALPLSANNGYMKSDNVNPFRILHYAGLEYIMTSTENGITTGPENLLEVKIVDSSLIHRGARVYSEYQNNTINNQSLEKLVRMNSLPLLGTGNIEVYNVTHFLNTYDMREFVTPTSYLEVYPFRENWLYIYGNMIQISNQYLDKLYVKILPTLAQINYVVYYETPENVISSGAINPQAVISSSSFDKWLQTNPNYKEIFNNEQEYKRLNSVISRQAGQSQLITNTLIGGAGGLASGDAVVAAVGAAGGLISGLANQAILKNTEEKRLDLDKEFELRSQKLLEGQMRDQPDQNYGDPSAISVIMNSYFGILMFRVTNRDSGWDFMYNKYQFNGFPVAVSKKPSELEAEWSLFFATNVKIIKGNIFNTIKNDYTTNAINNKLETGIIIIP